MRKHIRGLYILVMMAAFESAYSLTIDDLWYALFECSYEPSDLIQVTEYVEETGSDSADGQLLRAQIFEMIGNSNSDNYFDKAEDCLEKYLQLGGETEIYNEEKNAIDLLREQSRETNDNRTSFARSLESQGDYHWGGFYKNLELVDLGLSVRWANCNVGAQRPEDHGDVFAWGECAPKKKYTKKTSDVYEMFQLYPQWSINHFASGSISDSKYRDPSPLCTRIPTKQHMLELMYYCNWERDTLNNVAGWRVTGPNGNFIFMPNTFKPKENRHVSMAGYGNTTVVGDGREGGYWTADLDLETSAYGVPVAYFLSLNFGFFDQLYTNPVEEGLTIRPIGYSPLTYSKNED